MAFLEEPTCWEKTILSDLQGAWSILRQLVVNNAGFQGWERMLPHIDKAMSWESVRNLSHMRNTLLIIRNLALQNAVPEEICQEIENITEILEEAIAIYP
jgi:hypothetical protein